LVVRYSDHAEQKLASRGVRREDVERVIANPKEWFKDSEHEARVAIGPLDGRFLVVVYRTVNGDTRVITVYHTRKLDKLVSSKIQRGVWREL
jgi:uncharacterized DUF497 family protein